MAIFAIVSDSPLEELAKRIEEVFPDEYYEVSEHAWLVYSSLTTKEVGEKVGLVPGEIEGPALVFLVQNYTGMEVKDTWEWLNSRRGKSE